VVKKNVERIFSIFIWLSSMIAVILGIKMIVVNFQGNYWIFSAIIIFGIVVPFLLASISQKFQSQKFHVERFKNVPAQLRFLGVALFSLIVSLIKIFPCLTN